MSASYDVRSPRARVPKELPSTSFPDRSPVRGPRRTVGHAIRRTRQWLLDQQDDDGSWCAELEGDTILESETILMLAFLGRENTPLARRAAAYLVRKQLPEGGWAKFPGGSLDISGSVKAYFALKLTGHDPAAEFMERARSGDPRPGRGRRGQQFYAVPPGPLGTDFLRTLPGRSAGDGPLAEMVPREPLRDERLVADDRRAAFDRGRLGARAPDRTRSAASTNCSSANPSIGRRFAARGCRAEPAG